MIWWWWWWIFGVAGTLGGVAYRVYLDVREADRLVRQMRGDTARMIADTARREADNERLRDALLNLSDPLLAEFEKLEQQVADECEHDALHGGDPKKAARVRARYERRYGNEPAFLLEIVDPDATFNFADEYLARLVHPDNNPVARYRAAAHANFLRCRMRP